MTKSITRYHHYKGKQLSRSENIEKKVIELILNSKLQNEKRESSKVWELKHSSGCIQISRILAQRRNLNIELAEIIAALHDIYVITNGKYKNHAILGGKIADKLLRHSGAFSEKEIQTIVSAVSSHSQKDIYSNEPYSELIKDADTFDCSLYKGSEVEYRLTKSEPIFKEYAKRLSAVRKELGLPKEPLFRK